MMSLLLQCVLPMIVVTMAAETATNDKSQYQYSGAPFGANINQEDKKHELTNGSNFMEFVIIRVACSRHCLRQTIENCYNCTAISARHETTVLLSLILLVTKLFTLSIEIPTTLSLIKIFQHLDVTGFIV